MALCLIEDGYAPDCGAYTMAGITELYLGNFNEIDTISISGNGEITGIIMQSGKVFYQYEFAENTGFINNELTNSNGNLFYNTNVTFTLANTGQSLLEVIKQIDFSELAVIARLRTGKYVFVGETNFLRRTAGNINTGTAPEDASGAVITLTGAGPGPYRYIAESVDVYLLL